MSDPYDLRTLRDFERLPRWYAVEEESDAADWQRLAEEAEREEERREVFLRFLLGLAAFAGTVGLLFLVRWLVRWLVP
jgi:hypothetical protein